MDVDAQTALKLNRPAMNRRGAKDRRGICVMNEKTFRKNLVELLRGGHAFVTPAKALEAVSAKKRHVQPGPGLHSVWEELEHIRIAQEDIIRYAMDPSWVSPEFPKGY